ncbi:hypothetical protein BKA61DRAFT_675941 [Leptodontidium sp. MPI-SDFR-AT-0119]|nr:hypothetical protein BKA61DRAFT_675941 [Leptodontidium sp. MPI-SDFR-AT-0119]
MASTSAPSSGPSEGQTRQGSAPVEHKASKDASPEDPQSETDQASKPEFDEEPTEIFEPKDYEPEGSSEASGK